jgi:hypothetical protein
MKVKFGAIVTDGRGKIGGHVLSKNRGGAYMRTKVTPSNPQTSYQSAVRNRLTTLSQAWRSLAASAIAAWNSAVSNFESTDIFGDLKSPSGLNLYVKLNSNLAEAGVSALALPPLPSSVTGPVTIAVTGAAGTPALSIAWTGGAIPANTVWVVRATKQISPGKAFVKNLYRNVINLPAADATPTDILLAYNTKFGTLVAGQKIGFSVVAINMLTGQKSTELNTTMIVAA